jgi:hypothetical protein
MNTLWRAVVASVAATSCATPSATKDSVDAMLAMKGMVRTSEFRRCLPYGVETNIEALTDRALLISTGIGTTWINEIPRECPIAIDPSYSVKVPAGAPGQICEDDLLRPRADSGRVHGSCKLGRFQRVQRNST